MSNVRILPGEGRRSPDAILGCAMHADLKDVLVVGTAADGSLFVSCSAADYAEIALLAVRLNAWLADAVEP